MKREKKSTKHNYCLMLADGACFQSGLGFLNATTVLPLFINMMTGNKALLGLVLALGSCFTHLFRLVIGPRIPNISDYVKFNTKVNFLCRPLILIPAVMLLVGLEQGTVALVCLSYLMIYVGDGLIMPGWMEYMAGTIEKQRQGSLLGTQQFLGGLVGILSSLVVQTLLTHASGNSRVFGWIFLLSGAMMFLSCAAVGFTVDIPRTAQTEKISYGSYFRNLLPVLRQEKDFQRLMVTYILQFAAGMSASFVIVYAQEAADLSKSATSYLVVAQALGIPLGGLLWGNISKRFGPGWVMRLAPVTVTCVPALALLSALLPQAAFVLLFTALILAGVSAGVWVGLYAYIAAAVSENVRPQCMVLMSILMLPFTFCQYFAGAIADAFGFYVLFGVACAIGIAGMLSTSGLRNV